MKKLSDYTPEQVANFNRMAKVLEDLNKLYAQSGKIIDQRPFTVQEMAELSRYQQLVIASKAEFA